MEENKDMNLGDAQAPAEQLKKAKKKNLGLRITMILLLIFLLLIVGVGALAYGYYHDVMGNLRPDETRDPNETLSPSEWSELETDPFGSEMDDLINNLPLVEPTMPSIGSTEGERPEYLDHVINILLIGTDERSKEFTHKARGDSCMLLSINTAGDHPVVSLVSFERGMGMPILSGKYAGQWDWFTHLFRYGGAEMMMESIEACFDIELDYYVRVNFNTFTQGIDALGGVDVEMNSKELAYFNQAWGFEGKVGINHLDGKYALRFARLREIDSDWKRIERQRKVIASAINKVKNKSFSELDALIDTCTQLVRTNVTEELVTKIMLRVVPGLTNVEIQQMTIPVKGTYGSHKVMGDRSAFAPDFEENTRLLHNLIYGLDN
jgi:LCP family protein required for cell wall assembly